MQGTQYAPRESILCMEHFVALQRADDDPLLVLFGSFFLPSLKHQRFKDGEPPLIKHSGSAIEKLIECLEFNNHSSIYTQPQNGKTTEN